LRLSPFFADLRSAYEAELDDLTTDSGGHDVLGKRLETKRSQLAQLVPMIESSPEMVAVAFHGAFRFPNPAVMRGVTTQEPEDLPSWSALRASVEIAPWADDLVAIVLQEAAGDRFLVLTACLEYLQGQPVATDDSPGRVPQAPADEEEDEDYDLDEAGADWLAEQGFDHKDRFSGE